VPAGLALAGAAFVKSADPAEFVYQMDRYQMLPHAWVPVAAAAIIVVEFTLGLGLLLDARPRITVWGAGLLLAGFTVVVAYAWSQGRIQQCGCFGHSIQRTPGETVFEDALLVATLAGAILLLRAGPPARSGVSMLVASLAAGIFLSVAMPRLPVDNLVTALRPGARPAHLDPETLQDDLLKGEHFIALWQIGCDACLADFPRVENLASEPGVPQVTALFPDTNDAVMTFFLEHGPSFDVAAMPRAALKPYYRKLPVYFLLRDGRVLSVWRHGAPDAASVRKALARSLRG
jgi:hypothetical protein